MEHVPKMTAERPRRVETADSQPLATHEAMPRLDDQSAEQAARLREAQELLERELRFEQDPTKASQNAEATPRTDQAERHDTALDADRITRPADVRQQTTATLPAMAAQRGLRLLPHTKRQLLRAYAIVFALLVLILIIVIVQSL